MLCSHQRQHGCPLYKFSYASFSNIMSSWFQYEALKFVSFPTQVYIIPYSEIMHGLFTGCCRLTYIIMTQYHNVELSVYKMSL